MVDLTNSQTKIVFTKNMDRLIRKAVKKTLKMQRVKNMGVSVLITDNEFIKDLNKKFREIDSPTDVLSFPLYDDEGNLDDSELGDIVISIEKAQRQAEEYGHSLEREIVFLTVHAMLHLLGYDHVDDETEMFRLQKEIMENISGISCSKNRSVWQSVGFALSGVWFCIKNERNFRFHIFAATTVALLSTYYGFNTAQKAIIVIVISSVMICELFNTAVEAAIDTKTKNFNCLAKIAKDVSAGAVLLSALCSVICGLFLFLKIDIIHNILKDILNSPVKIICAVAYLAAGYLFVRHFPNKEGCDIN
ncbi:MAG: rRNA maturation RNase YbeY [Firmicutes bacterium]|nr:rRNA maturation RNase YbeY [Bacillota bacterium]